MPDKRGLLTPSEYSMLLKTRAAEQWERIDSIVIGPGAAAVDDEWFNTWAAFAAAETLVWFNGRSNSVGESFSNQKNERTDWAQDIYSVHLEFIPPTATGGLASDPNDGQFSPQWFVSELREMMPFRVRLSETDDMSLSAGSHYPAGFGTAYASLDASAAPAGVAGTNGQPYSHKNGWRWPEPLKLAAKSTISLRATVDQPARAFLGALPGPGFRLVPDGAGGTIELPNWYIIRATLRGPRYLQLRQARSSA